MARLDPRLASAGLLRLAAWSLARQRGQPAVSDAPGSESGAGWMTEAWLRDLFTLLAEGGHLEIVCTETLHWTPAQIAEVRQWVAQSS